MAPLLLWSNEGTTPAETHKDTSKLCNSPETFKKFLNNQRKKASRTGMVAKYQANNGILRTTPWHTKNNNKKTMVKLRLLGHSFF